MMWTMCVFLLECSSPVVLLKIHTLTAISTGLINTWEKWSADQQNAESSGIYMHRLIWGYTVRKCDKGPFLIKRLK